MIKYRIQHEGVVIVSGILSRCVSCDYVQNVNVSSVVIQETKIGRQADCWKLFDLRTTTRHFISNPTIIIFVHFALRPIVGAFCNTARCGWEMSLPDINGV